jgi:nicotinate-nucleotide adenylyltransferase
MTVKKAIIFGGAFNPPTRAHQSILQACVEYAETINAEVWLLPSGNRTDKVIPTAIEVRLDYLAAMIEETETTALIQVNPIEMERNIDVETYDSIIELQELYPEYELIWVFGADSTQTMEEWKNGSWLIENTQMLLIERPGSIINAAIRNWSSLSVDTIDTSSTELRRRIAAEEDFSDIVTSAVHRLLIQHQVFAVQEA